MKLGILRQILQDLKHVSWDKSQYQQLFHGCYKNEKEKRCL
jgi:hypothetical protein